MLSRMGGSRLGGASVRMCVLPYIYRRIAGLRWSLLGDCGAAGVAGGGICGWDCWGWENAVWKDVSEMDDRDDRDESDRVDSDSVDPVREDEDDHDPLSEGGEGDDGYGARPTGYFQRVWVPWPVAEGLTMTVVFSATRARALLRVNMARLLWYGVCRKGV
jgi:hypothetical protein